MKTTLTLELPPEYLALCERDKLHRKEIILSFIADLCAIVPWRGAPRGDQYCSTGDEGRELAWEYYEAVGFASRNLAQPHDSD
jgi:hypothetical protein